MENMTGIEWRWMMENRVEMDDGEYDWNRVEMDGE